MLRKVYISIGYHKREAFDHHVQAIKTAVESCNLIPFVFVDEHKFDVTGEKNMMKQAMEDIDQCDLFIAETSDKAIGVGIEAGYAKGKGKPVIYVRHEIAEHSTTVSGISDYQVVFSDSEDLGKKLKEVLTHVAQR